MEKNIQENLKFGSNPKMLSPDNEWNHMQKYLMAHAQDEDKDQNVHWNLK